MYSWYQNTDPIDTLRWRRIELLPDHIRKAMTTPLDGYADTALDSAKNAGRKATCDSPRTDGLFVMSIPASAQDANDYISAAFFPRKKEHERVIGALHHPLQTRARRTIWLAAAVLATILGIAINNTAFDPVPDDPVWNIVRCLEVIAACWLGVFIAMCVVVASTVKSGEYDTPTEPIALMREIESRSIHIPYLVETLGSKAWDIYFYDYEHYNEFALLCKSMVDIDPEPSLKTKIVQAEVINAFVEKSLVRQEETKRLIQARYDDIEAAQRAAAREEAAIACEERIQREIADQAQADAIGEVFLKPLQGENR